MLKSISGTRLSSRYTRTAYEAVEDAIDLSKEEDVLWDDEIRMPKKMNRKAPKKLEICPPIKSQ